MTGPSSRKFIEIKKVVFPEILRLAVSGFLSVFQVSKSLPLTWSPIILLSVARFKLFLCRRLQSWFNIWHFMPQVRLSSIRLHRMSKDVRILGFNSPLWKCKLEGFMMTLCKISTIWLEMTSCQARICMMFSQKSDFNFSLPKIYKGMKM